MQSLTALRHVSRALHRHWSASESSGQKLCPGRDVESRDLELKVKAAPSSSTIVGSKAYGHVMSVGRQGDFEPRHCLVDFPHLVTALDVYKVNIYHHHHYYDDY